jgi:hypothetical protein
MHLCCADVLQLPVHCCLQAGYPCLSLHGGKEQSDRECTIADFKGAVCNILVATSIAARGLDVRDLVLVVNYDVPNHHEDYVHRCACAALAVALCCHHFHQSLVPPASFKGMSCTTVTCRATVHTGATPVKCHAEAAVRPLHYMWYRYTTKVVMSCRCHVY